MKDLDEKIRAALCMEDAELLEHYRGEQSIPQMIIDSFRSRHRWLCVAVMAVGVLLFVLEIFVAYQFFQAESTRAMIAWATGFVTCCFGTVMGKLWYWMELNKNTLAREIKRLELELASLSRRLSSAPPRS